MKLYRGDNINNSTQPGRYYMDGIRSKSFGKGSPTYIEANGLLENIRKHVNPASAVDMMVYDRTEFISFTTSFERAFFWLSGQGSEELRLLTDRYQETRYLFGLEIDEKELEAIDQAETMFIFRFACNPNLKMPNSPNVIEQAMASVVSLGTWFRSCQVCETLKCNHSLVLIDTVKYLHTYKNNERFEGAILNATLDKEWLVLPTDHLSGFSGTVIPRADFWSAEHYISVTEARPKGIHEMEGQIFDSAGLDGLRI